MLDYSRCKQATPFLDGQKLIAWEPLWPIYNPQLSRGESEFLLNCLARHFDPLAKAVKMQSLWIVDLTSLNDFMARCLRCRPKYFHLLPIWDVSSKGVSNLKVDGVTESSVRRVCITTTWAINVLSFNLVESMTISRPFRRKQVQHITHWTMLMCKLTFINFRQLAEPFHFAAFHPTQFRRKIGNEILEICLNCYLTTAWQMELCCLLQIKTTTSTPASEENNYAATSRAVFLEASQGVRRAATSWRTPSWKRMIK